MQRETRWYRKSLFFRFLAVLLVSVLLIGSLQAAADQGIPDKPLARNIIVMIADGCGFNQIDAASLYQYGQTGVQVYEGFPVRYAMSTYSVGSYDPALAWSDFNYVRIKPTDSSAAATAMSTGVKTYDKAIGVDMDGNPVKHIAERAEELGKSSGVVTSVQISHATPASFVAHNPDRNAYAAIANEMILSSKADVIMGAGNPWFDDSALPRLTPAYQYVGGQATWDGLVAGTLGGDADGDGVADPWTLVQSQAEFQSLMTGETPKRVLGVAQVATTLQQGRAGDRFAAPYVVPFSSNVPALTEMAKAALNVLDEDPDGFFLMVEGGAVDWANHSNQSGRLIEEEVAFNQAVEAVVAWVEANSNWGETLLIVTGDHETGYLTGPDSDPTWQPLVNNGAGVLPGMEWHSTNHTNSLIAIFAKGDAARVLRRYADQVDPVRGRYVDNTEVAKTCFEAIE